MRHLRFFTVMAAIMAMISLGTSVAPAGAGGTALHDNFYTPQPIPAYFSNTTYYADNYGASKQLCEPNHAGNPGGSSVWFRLGARATRSLVSLNTRGANFDTTVAVYRGNNLCNLRLVQYDDDCPNVVGPSCLQFVAGRFRTYRIAVDGYNGAQGDFPLRIRRVRF